MAAKALKDLEHSVSRAENSSTASSTGRSSMPECYNPLQQLPNINACQQVVSKERSRGCDPEPGAVRVQGFNQAASSLSASERLDGKVFAETAIVEELVTTVETEVVREDNQYRLQETQQKRMRLIRLVCCGFVAGITAAAIAIVIVLLTRPSPKQQLTPKPTRTPNPTSKPTPMHPMLKPAHVPNPTPTPKPTRKPTQHSKRDAQPLMMFF